MRAWSVHLTAFWILFAAPETAIDTGEAGDTGARERLVLAHQFNTDTLSGESAFAFAELAGESTGHRVFVSILPNAVMGDDFAILPLLFSGRLDMALLNDFVLSRLVPAHITAVMPFVYPDAESKQALFENSLGAEISDILLREHGLRVLAWQYTGMRMIMADRPYRSFQDMQGVSFRAPADEGWLRVWANLGVQVSPLTFTQFGPALERNRVQAAENLPGLIRGHRFNRLRPYLLDSRHSPQIQVFVISAERFYAMSAPRRRTLQAAAESVARETSRRADAYQAQALRWLTTEGGMTLVPFDPDGGVAALEATVVAYGPEHVMMLERIRELISRPER